LHLTFWETTEKTRLSFDSVQAILIDDLNMEHVNAKFVLHIVTDR
jgi:hypothetical protein